MKLVLGFWLKEAASAYMHHFDRRQKKNAARVPISRASAAADISKLTKKD